jgi:hypothetical protein
MRLISRWFLLPKSFERNPITDDGYYHDSSEKQSARPLPIVGLFNPVRSD